MNLGNVHAVVLLFILLVTALMCVRLPKQIPLTIRRVVLTLILVPPAFLVAGAAGVHKCDCGLPLVQWILPGICGFLVVLLLKSRLTGIMTGLSLLIIAFILTINYATIVHYPQYIGRSNYSEGAGTCGNKEPHPFWHSWLTGIYGTNHVAEMELAK